MRHFSIFPTARASASVYNSPLSEFAALGFEYGYAVAVPNGLVLWEAQFGDFVNNAQVVIDQFIASGFSKWGETSRLTLLLPHMDTRATGPEHSSARVERFLALAAQGNFRIANCSTPAQYFHLHPASSSRPPASPAGRIHAEGAPSLQGGDLARASELVDGTCSSRSLTTHVSMSQDERERIGRLILCSGRVYYDLTGYRWLRTTFVVSPLLDSSSCIRFPVPAYVELLQSYRESL